MMIYRLKDAPLDSADVVFSARPPIEVFIFVLLVDAAAITGIVYGHTHQFVVPAPLCYLVAGLLTLVILPLLVASIRKARLPTSWILRFDGRRLLIKYRSYLNEHFSADDPQVIALEKSEVAWMRITRERRYQSGSEGDEMEFLHYLDIATQKVDTTTIEALLLAETMREPPRKRITTKFNDVPVRLVEGNILRIRWLGTSGILRPRLKRAAAIFSRSFTFREPLKIETDLRTRKKLSPEEKDARIRELALSGEKIQAVAMARSLHKLSLAAAETYVEKLLLEGGESPKGDDQT